MSQRGAAAPKRLSGSCSSGIGFMLAQACLSINREDDRIGWERVARCEDTEGAGDRR